MDLDIKLIKTSTNIQPRWLTLVRVALGALLFWKGISFLESQSTLEASMQNIGIDIFSRNAKLLAGAIAYLHLLGGTFIAIGFLTRIASLVQIPILIGAVLFNLSSRVYVSPGELILSILVLALLVVFIIKGSGYFSTDEYFKSYYLRREQDID